MTKYMEILTVCNLCCKFYKYLIVVISARYPNRIAHLVLVDPWGFPERPLDAERRTPLPAWVKMVSKVLQVFNPLAALRAAGPWGEWGRIVTFYLLQTSEIRIIIIIIIKLYCHIQHAKIT